MGLRMEPGVTRARTAVTEMVEEMEGEAGDGVVVAVGAKTTAAPRATGERLITPKRPLFLYSSSLSSSVGSSIE